LNSGRDPAGNKLAALGQRLKGARGPRRPL